MIKSLLILFAAVNFPASHSFESNMTKKAAILGLWKGTFTVEDGSTGTFYFSIKPNNQLLIENYHKGVQRIANGTWRLKGRKFECAGEYFYGHPSNIGTITRHTAIFDGSSKLEKGIWQNVTPNNDTGEFTLQKVK